MPLLHLLRHPETIFNEGDTSNPLHREYLSERGQKSAELFSWLYRHYFDGSLVWMSDRSRTSDLLRMLSSYNSFDEIHTDKRLNERNYGTLGTMSKTEIIDYLSQQGHRDAEDKNFSKLMDQQIYDSNGKIYFESNKFFVQRVEDLLQEILLLSEDDDKILIICHGGTIRALMSALLGYKMVDIDHLLYKTHNRIPNLSMTTIDYSKKTKKTLVHALAYVDPRIECMLEL